jgi:type II pantothenate kinase
LALVCPWSRCPGLKSSSGLAVHHWEAEHCGDCCPCSQVREASTICCGWPRRATTRPSTYLLVTSTHIASSFGKVYKKKRAAERDAEDGCNGDFKRRGEEEHVEGSSEMQHSPSGFAPEDISRSLLYAVSNNIGQIAYLHAEKHGLERIYFGGSFIGGHAQTMNTLSYAIRFWSKNSKQAYFLRHEGYLGAVGAFLKRQPRNWGRRESFQGTRPIV